MTKQALKNQIKEIGCPYDTKDDELHLDKCLKYNVGGYNFDCNKCISDWFKANKIIDEQKNKMD